MKIAIFTDTFPPQINGVANVAYQSAVGLVRLGHKVTVFTAASGFDDKINDATDFRADGFDIVRIPSVAAPVYPGYRLAIPIGFAVNKIIEFKPDIIHTHTPFSVGWELIGPAKLMHIPIVGTHHTFYDHYLQHAKLDFEWAKKMSWMFTLGYYNRCNLILSPSKSLATELQSHGLKRPFQILANTIDTESFKPVLDKATKDKLKANLGITGKSLVYMGRLSYEKSIDQVILATAEVVKEIPTLKLVVIGDGPEKAKLEKLALTLGIKHNVIFTGFRQNHELVETLQANDIFLTASKTENMPLSVMEGMACGLPVIGADALGIPEIVLDNKNGFLFQPDDWKEMAQKILILLEDESTLNKFSKASYQMSENFSEKNMAKSLEKIYEKLIKEKKK